MIRSVTSADWVGHGVRVGLNMCMIGIPGFDPASVNESDISMFVVDSVLGSLQDRGEVWPQVAIEFVSEVISVGVCTRAHLGEPLLTRGDVDAFLTPFGSITRLQAT
jgi:hypothetical protein